MNKFIGKKTTKSTKKTVKKDIVVEEAPKEVIKKGVQEFIICPRCGWQHSGDTVRCRFCGKKLQG